MRIENANKFKVVNGITVLDCSTPYMLNQTKKYIADKYKGLGIADDAMLAKLWKNIVAGYTVVDFELPKYDIDTVNAAFDELGKLYGKCTDISGDLAYAFNLNKKVDQLPVFIGAKGDDASYYSLEILANYNSSSDEGTTLYTSIGWCDSRKDEEVAIETLQHGKPFFWSFVNWVKVYIVDTLAGLGGVIRAIAETVEQGIFDNHLEVKVGSIRTVIEQGSIERGSTLKFNFVKNNKNSAYFITYNEKGQPTYKGTRLVFDPSASPYTGEDMSGVEIIGAKGGDVLLASGGYVSFPELFKTFAPAASLTEKGAVKRARKVDALADDATLVQAVDRLNTLIAYLKSAGLMSEN